MFGALNPRTGKVYWKQAKKVNSEQFIQFLHQLHQAFPHKLILGILDHASLHISKKVAALLARTPWVRLQRLAAYSPEYNPIERFWQWLKRKIYGTRSFTTIHDLMARIRKFMWHYNEKRVFSRIQFDFEMYKEIL